MLPSMPPSHGALQRAVLWTAVLGSALALIFRTAKILSYTRTSTNSKNRTEYLWKASSVLTNIQMSCLNRTRTLAVTIHMHTLCVPEMPLL